MSTIVTVALIGFILIILGNDPGVIARLKVSLLSTVLSFIMEMLNSTSVSPARILTVYSPET